MKHLLTCAALSIFLLTGIPVSAQLEFEAAKQRSYEAIDSSLFRDSIAHWQNERGGGPYPRYRPEQIVEIAQNLLAFQNDDGGWPKNLDWLAAMSHDEIRRLAGRSASRSTFDNRSTYPQIEYLAKVYQQTGLEACRASAERGLGHIFREQRPTGGWRGADVDAITFNDDVMSGVMHLLLDIKEGQAHFDWLDDERRRLAGEALERAIDATLKCQIVVNGKKTAWCQQHDHETFAPMKARTYELPSICAAESVGVVRFLMRIEKPSVEIVEAIGSAMAWFESSKIEGIRVDSIQLKEPVKFDHHTATSDRVVVEDPSAPPIWARFYEIDTNRPFFCNRDGIKVYSLAEVHPERRTGYAWYGYWPAKLSDEAARWRGCIGAAER